MEDDDLLSGKRIRFWLYSMRVKYPIGFKIALREGFPDTAFIALFSDLCVFYPYVDRDLFDRITEQGTFQSILEEVCDGREMLFVGELLRDRRICFEGPYSDTRVLGLNGLLQGTFGYHPLMNGALELVSLNPEIYLGSSNLGPLQTLVGFKGLGSNSDALDEHPGD